MQETLSKVSGELEDVKAANTFRRPRLQQETAERKLFEERNSLKNVSKTEVYISIPKTSEEFKNIFNEPNEAHLKNANKIREVIGNEHNPKVHF